MMSTSIIDVAISSIRMSPMADDRNRGFEIRQKIGVRTPRARTRISLRRGVI
jgi:hypothetical protein